MRLYNTLTRSKEEIVPRKPGHIGMYTCGPTVYHYMQIGNLRKYVFDDTLRRILKAQGLTVEHVMNITDVGHLTDDADAGADKLQSRAAEEQKSVWEVAEFYTNAVIDDLTALNVLPPTKTVPATSAIDRQIAMVQTLLDKGFAYQAEQAIYFDVTKLPDYGKLSGQRLNQKEVGARSDVITDTDKRHPADFALWFFTVGHFANHQMRWPAPWGEGFPGWHIECSAIIEQEFGPTVDIHTGGVDHIGTHHTNEIAQSEAAHDGAPLAKIWMHQEFLLIDGGRMGKSLGNAYTLADVMRRGFSPMALRMLYLQSHYRSQQNFTWEALDGAANLLERITAWADGQFQAGAGTLADDVFQRHYDAILAALADDLNTPQALAQFSSLLDTFDEYIMPTAEQVRRIDRLFGLRIDERRDITTEQKALILERDGARENRDFQIADRVRENLHSQGIELDDTPYGTRWRRK